MDDHLVSTSGHLLVQSMKFAQLTMYVLAHVPTTPTLEFYLPSSVKTTFVKLETGNSLVSYLLPWWSTLGRSGMWEYQHLLRVQQSTVVLQATPSADCRRCWVETLCWFSWWWRYASWNGWDLCAVNYSTTFISLCNTISLLFAI